MKVTKVAKLLALCAGVLLGFCAEAAIISTAPTVTPGVWSSDFNAALAKAEAENIPVMVFWGSVDCGHCKAVEKAMNTETFLSWMSENKILMVFKEGDAKSKTWIKDMAKERINEFPYVGVWWPMAPDGKPVREGFSAYDGNMSRYGAKSGMSNIEQLITALDFILADWDPNGDHPHVDPVEPVDPVDPVVPVKYTVTFVIDSTKATYTGSLKQEVEEGKAATAPTVKAKDGWKFTGWNKSFAKITANLTVTANFEAVRPDPVDPPHGDREEVDPSVVYKKAQSLSGVVYGDDLAGTATLKLGRISRLGKVKATLSLSLFDGGKASASATVTPNAFGDLVGIFKFRSKYGDVMPFALLYKAGVFELTAENELYGVELGTVQVGGKLDTDEMMFGAEMDYELPEDYDYVVDAPTGEPVHVRNGTKFSFDKAPSIKYKKFSEDGWKWYELVGLDDDEKTNVNSLKLSYKSSSGVFSGSFKVYGSNEFSVDEGKKPKLKTITVKVSGVIVDGVGFGTLKVGSRIVGSCSLE